MLTGLPPEDHEPPLFLRITMVVAIILAILAGLALLLAHMGAP